MEFGWGIASRSEGCNPAPQRGTFWLFRIVRSGRFAREA